jgi:hypothetical protein
MKCSHYHRQRGDEVNLTKNVERGRWEPDYSRFYGSAIFSSSAERVGDSSQHFPQAVVGGAWNALR